MGSWLWKRLWTCLKTDHMTNEQGTLSLVSQREYNTYFTHNVIMMNQFRYFSRPSFVFRKTPGHERVVLLVYTHTNTLLQ
jgi:hypothetical protein